MGLLQQHKHDSGEHDILPSLPLHWTYDSDYGDVLLMKSIYTDRSVCPVRVSQLVKKLKIKGKVMVTGICTWTLLTVSFMCSDNDVFVLRLLIKLLAAGSVLSPQPWNK